VEATYLRCDVVLVQVSLLRRELNGNLRDLVGDYRHVSSVLEVRARTSKSKDKSKGKGLKMEKIVLNDKNTMFVDIEAVQRTMVKLYGVTEAGIFTTLVICESL
jgi:hypothetical protein